MQGGKTWGVGQQAMESQARLSFIGSEHRGYTLHPPSLLGLGPIICNKSA